LPRRLVTGLVTADSGGICAPPESIGDALGVALRYWNFHCWSTVLLALYI